MERGPARGEETHRLTKVAELHREIALLKAQTSAKEQELRYLQVEPKLTLDFTGRTESSSVVLRPEEKIALFLELIRCTARRVCQFQGEPKLGKEGLRAGVRQRSRPGRTREMGYRVVMDQDVARTSLDLGLQ